MARGAVASAREAAHLHRCMTARKRRCRIRELVRTILFRGRSEPEEAVHLHDRPPVLQAGHAGRASLSRSSL